MNVLSLWFTSTLIRGSVQRGGRKMDFEVAGAWALTQLFCKPPVTRFNNSLSLDLGFT